MSFFLFLSFLFKTLRRSIDWKQNFSLSRSWWAWVKELALALQRQLSWRPSPLPLRLNQARQSSGERERDDGVIIITAIDLFSSSAFLFNSFFLARQAPRPPDVALRPAGLGPFLPRGARVARELQRAQPGAAAGPGGGARAAQRYVD